MHNRKRLAKELCSVVKDALLSFVIPAKAGIQAIYAATVSKPGCPLEFILSHVEGRA